MGMAKKNKILPENDLDIEPEPEQEYEQEEAYPEVSDQSSYFNTPFSKEQLQNAHLLRNTPYKDEVLYLLQQTTLSPSAKRAIKTFTEQFLSERTILANLTGVEMMNNNFDLAATKMKTNFWPSDLKKPILFHIIGLIRDHYNIVCTNATGEWRERMLNGKQTMAMEQINVNRSEPVMRVPDPKRKGIF